MEWKTLADWFQRTATKSWQEFDAIKSFKSAAWLLGAFVLNHYKKKVPAYWIKLKAKFTGTERLLQLEAKDKLHDEQIAAIYKFYDAKILVICDTYDKKLFLHQAQFMASIHTAGEPIALMDAGRNLIYCNPAYLKLTGANERDVLGTGYMELIAEADKARVAKSREDLLKNPHSNESTVTFKNIITGIETKTIYRTEPIRRHPLEGQTIGEVEMIIARFREIY